MIKKIAIMVFGIALLNSCVSAKVYKDLQGKYADLQNQRDQLTDENQKLQAAQNDLENNFEMLEKEYDQAIAQRDQLQQQYDAAKNNLKNLQASYDALEKNSSTALSENAKKNKELLAQLEAKESALAAESARLEKLRNELNERSQRVDELESMIASKDEAMKRLKEAISNALLDFQGKGLTVEQRDGKVYVSMENKLLFPSGSWSVNAEGKRAVNQLASVLAQNPDISVLIEGHTDNVPYGGNGPLKDNWDLSTKRATAIVEILMNNPGIQPESLTAAGKGEFDPVASNDTPEGRAKNRRIDVILTPKLDEITKLLNNN
ncbi:OmpA family protein [Zhouia sp. PK063]|uniref:OmpA family protein n=1 Tax=Zhouia sp. PK063 TaxID=3373602 RepID=UPI00379E56A1